jgi:hypothetical protein
VRQRQNAQQKDHEVGNQTQLAQRQRVRAFEERGVTGGESLAERFEHHPDVIVLAPHDLRWSGDAVLLEVGGKGVSLAGVMLLIPQKLLVQLAPDGKLRLEIRPRQVALVQVPDEPAHPASHRGDGPVLRLEVVQRMAGPQRSAGRFAQQVADDLRMEITHSFDLVDARALGHELLDAGDLRP